MIVPRSALKAVSLAMAVKGIRKWLNGMLIQCSGITVRLVATDGHRLHMMDIPQDIPCPPLVEGVIVPRAMIEWALKNSKPGMSVQVTIDGGMVKIAASGAIMSGAAIDERFPDYSRILPREAPSGIVAQFNPRHVSDAYTAAMELIPKYEELIPLLRHNGPHAAATVSYERFLAVIMPLRVTLDHAPDARLFSPVADDAPIE